MLLSPDEAKRITDQLLSRSRAQHCTVKLEGSAGTNLRFARGSATTNGSGSTLYVYIQSRFGRRWGGATVSSLDERDLDETQRHSEEIARAAPENPGATPPLGPQAYEQGAGYDAETAAVRAARLATAAKPVIDEAGSRALDVAGFAVARQSFDAFATSAGLFVHERHTGAEFTVTARNKAGTWSGWAGVSETRFGRLDTSRLGQRAIDKAAHTTTPVRLEPGKYTIILEPSAVSDLVGSLLGSMNAQPADEGRSFFSRKGGGNRIGEKLFQDNVTIFSDPNDPNTPERTFGEEGVPHRRTVWIANGVVQNLFSPRFWARRQGREPIPRPRSFIMAGGTASIDDMIRDVKRGVLVTRFWYIRMLDPQKLVLTGLTRDGNFLIEDGRIVAPALNFRFNESPAAVLGNILAMGPSERTRGGEQEGTTASVPPLLVKDFNFSSASDAI
jgi:predicted Zn-dependent protease